MPFRVGIILNCLTNQKCLIGADQARNKIITSWRLELEIMFALQHFNLALTVFGLTTTN